MVARNCAASENGSREFASQVCAWHKPGHGQDDPNNSLSFSDKSPTTQAAGHEHGPGAQVRMWVYEEEVDGRKLTEVINKRHENVKYLPGVHLGDNILACPDLGV